MKLAELASLAGIALDGPEKEMEITGAASLDEAGESDISFFGHPRYAGALKRTKAAAVLVPADHNEPIRPVPLRVANPSAAFAAVLEKFAPPQVAFQPGVHSSAVVADDAEIHPSASIQPLAVIESGAKIGPGTVIGAHCYIGHQAVVGAHCQFHPRVSVRERCEIGDRVILHPGVVIGSDGFGYELLDGRHVKIPQTGIVRIDDDVEIGANTTVDRARFGRTWLQQGAKIDNLVQIAHNVTIGAHTILCAQVGISGSTKVGAYVTMAGKVGVNGHIEVGDAAVITAMAGVTKSVPPKEVLVGLPARPMKEYKTNFVLTHNIHKLYDRVKALEQAAAKASSQS